MDDSRVVNGMVRQQKRATKAAAGGCIAGWLADRLLIFLLKVCTLEPREQSMMMLMIKYLQKINQ